MRITIKSNLSRASIQEGSAFTVTAKFYDDASDPWTLSAPTTIRYRVDNLSDGQSVLDWTTVSAASSASIVITGAQNALQNQDTQWETHELTVQANSGLSTQYSEKYRWKIINILGIT